MIKLKIASLKRLQAFVSRCRRVPARNMQGLGQFKEKQRTLASKSGSIASDSTIPSSVVLVLDEWETRDPVVHPDKNASSREPNDVPETFVPLPSYPEPLRLQPSFAPSSSTSDPSSLMDPRSKKSFMSRFVRFHATEEYRKSNVLLTEEGVSHHLNEKEGYQCPEYFTRFKKQSVDLATSKRNERIDTFQSRTDAQLTYEDNVSLLTVDDILSDMKAEELNRKFPTFRLLTTLEVGNALTIQDVNALEESRNKEEKSLSEELTPSTNLSLKGKGLQIDHFQDENRLHTEILGDCLTSRDEDDEEESMASDPFSRISDASNEAALAFNLFKFAHAASMTTKNSSELIDDVNHTATRDRSFFSHFKNKRSNTRSSDSADANADLIGTEIKCVKSKGSQLDIKRDASALSASSSSTTEGSLGSNIQRKSNLEVRARVLNDSSKCHGSNDSVDKTESVEFSHGSSIVTDNSDYEYHSNTSFLACYNCVHYERVSSLWKNILLQW